MHALKTAFVPAALTGAALLLAACGGGGSDEQASSGSASSGAAPAAAAEKSEEQVKALLATLPAPYNAADIANGKTKFVQCKACHTLEKGGSNLTGPNLHGLFGLKAGTEPAEYKYSEPLKASGITWDAATLDQWIENPRKLVPGTKMTYAGMANPKDRADLIAYLKVATSD